MLIDTLVYLRANTPKEQKRFIKFLIVGGIGFIVDFTAFNILARLISFNTLRLDLAVFYLIIGPKVIAQAISFSLATVSNFTWNYFWIYREAQGQPVLPRIGQFVTVSIIGLAIRTPIFTLFDSLAHKAVVSVVGSQNLLPIDVAGNLALAGAVLIVLLWNFYINRKWTYRDVK